MDDVIDKPQPPTPAGSSGGPTYEPPTETVKPVRSLAVQVVADTFGRPAAKIAAVWILILVLGAVFSPFLCNSRPFVAWWADGRTTYPLFAALNWLDLTLLGMFFLGLALFVIGRFVRPLPWGTTLLVLVIAGGALASASSLSVHPPELEDYAMWRKAEASGELQRSITAVIPYSPNDAIRDDLVRDRLQQPPDSEHWLGTTVHGEDLLSRLIFATRIALGIGFISTGIAAVIGVIYGGVIGYFAGAVDLFGMRLIEIVEAVPQLVLLMIVTQFFGKDIMLMMVTIGLIAWTGNARFIRAEFLKLRSLDYVQAGKALGLPLPNLLFRHMLPNGIAPVLVNVSFGVASAILLESVLSFLGLGLEAETASWGQLLDQARQGGSGFNWWIATFPGLAIFLTVFAYILIGEAMRDAIDPKLSKE